MLGLLQNSVRFFIISSEKKNLFLSLNIHILLELNKKWLRTNQNHKSTVILIILCIVHEVIEYVMACTDVRHLENFVKSLVVALEPHNDYPARKVNKRITVLGFLVFI